MSWFPSEEESNKALFMWGGILILILLCAVLFAVFLPFILVIAGCLAAYQGYQHYILRKRERLTEREFEVHAAKISALPLAPPAETFSLSVIKKVIDHHCKGRNRMIVYPVIERIVWATEKLYEKEDLQPALVKPVSNDPMDIARWKDKVAIATSRSKDATLLQTIDGALSAAFEAIVSALPPSAYLTSHEYELSQKDLLPEPNLTIPYYDCVTDIGRVVIEVCAPFYSEKTKNAELFNDIRNTISDNFNRTGKGDKAVSPLDHKGTPIEVATTYLRGIPFLDILQTPIPITIPEELRYSGTWVIAPSGRGKTTLLINQILEDAQKPGSIIICDSKGDLINAIKDLKLSKDIIVIDPEMNLALNPLDIGGHSVELLEYIMGSILDAELTPRQSTLFRRALQACLTYDKPNLRLFMSIIAKGTTKTFGDPDLENFFVNMFNTSEYSKIRQELGWRIDLLISNNTVKSMLTAPETKIRIDKLMNEDKIIIWNNSIDALGEGGSMFMGRLLIALVLSAGQQRASQETKNPVYFYIDECDKIIARDTNVPKILDTLRSQKVAITLAHQRIVQIKSTDVMSALYNCAIRYANSDDDAAQIAPRLRTTTDHLRELEVGQFAVFIRDRTKAAATLNVRRTDLASLPRLTGQEIAARKTKMRERYHYVPVVARPEPPSPPPTHPTETDQSADGLISEAVLNYKPPANAANAPKVPKVPKAPKQPPRRQKKSPVEDPGEPPSQTF